MATNQLDNMSKEDLIAEVIALREGIAQYKKSRDFLETITDNFPGYIAYFNNKEEYQFANEPYVKMFGLGKTEIVGKTLKEVLGEFYDLADPYIKRVIKGESVSFENRIVLDSKKIDVSVKYVPLFVNNKVNGFIALINDITQIKTDQETLKKLQEYLDTILFNLPVGVAIMEGEEFEYFRINKYLATLNGMPVDQHLGKVLKDVLPNADKIIPSLRQVRETGESIMGREFNIVLPKDPDNPIHLIDWVFPITLGDEIRAVGVVVLDITKTKELEKELIVAKETAESASRAKTQFLATMSHEIRTPLGAISGMVYQLTQQMDETCESCFGLDSSSNSFSDSMRSIKLASQNLTQTVNQILDLAKIESGKYVVNNEDMSLKECCLGVIEVNRGVAAEKQIKIRCNCNTFTVDKIVSDQMLISQIIMNLLSNAIKFSLEGSEVELRYTTLENNCLKLVVIDQGIGIPEARLDAIFDAFEQGDSSIIREYRGTGLGLAICKKNIDLLGGTIQVKSDLNKGTTFTVVLPYKVAGCTPRKQAPKLYQFSKDKHLLLVEDDMLNQNMMKKIFNMYDISFEIAGTGEEALQKMKKKPSLVLMDVHMPGMDGIETTKQLMKMEAGNLTPVYALSADVFSENDPDLQLFKGFITKPIEFDKLLQVLAEYLSDSPKEPPPSEARIPVG